MFLNTLWASLCTRYTDVKSLKDPEGNWGYLIDNTPLQTHLNN